MTFWRGELQELTTVSGEFLEAASPVSGDHLGTPSAR